jgi:hypothetical protein
MRDRHDLDPVSGNSIDGQIWKTLQSKKSSAVPLIAPPFRRILNRVARFVKFEMKCFGRLNTSFPAILEGFFLLAVCRGVNIDRQV